MLDKDRYEQHLLGHILDDEVRYQNWRRYFNSHRRRIPLYPGSRIRDASIILMEEFLELGLGEDVLALVVTE